MKPKSHTPNNPLCCNGEGCDRCGPSEQDAQREALASAWAWGYLTGAMDERDDPGGKAKTPNPYREAAS